ncbi:hypothetical protein AXK57_21925 [Tsukamurella pulmonis]|uniref:hypothetical protein n=1 Tax=Tsukamurella pulmonis TaxID=47312 RepID=UPI00079A2158|nr:hypothetical protein [Tsukamurella pulmonis]KXP11602.1 hypothetical protein AXK57_21925 [Tsukamurella pulmonis]
MTTKQMKTAGGVLAAAALGGALLAGCGGGGLGSIDETSTTTTKTGAAAWRPGDPTAGAATTTTTVRPTATAPTAAAGAAPRPTTLNPAVVDVRNPEAVSVAVVTTWFTWNTGTDSSPADAVQRASALLTSKLSAANAPSRTPLTGPGAEWLTLATVKAVVTPTVGKGDAQGRKNTSMSAGYLHKVTLRSATPDGRPVTASRVVIVATTLANTPNGWRVDDVTPL